mgnify:CR=1 FL=1
MNPEEPIVTDPVETVPEEPVAVETVPADDPVLIELKSLNEIMAWSIAFQVSIMAILMITLFFTALKAGKS